MNRLDYVLVARQPVNRPSDFAGKKIGIGGGVGGADSLAARLAFERLGVNPSTVTMISTGARGNVSMLCAPAPSMPPSLAGELLSALDRGCTRSST
jgi:hypothetical protein